MQETRSAAVKAIRLHLAAQDKKQPWLAAQVGRSEFWLSRRMSGAVSFKVEDLEEVAAVFGRTVPELILDASKIPSFVGGAAHIAVLPKAVQA